MHRRTHRLLSRYMTHATSRMYPIEPRLKANPLVSGEWFRYAVTDAAMLHAMLYAGAIYLALLEGKTESRDTVYHLGQTIHIVNQRLSQSKRPPEDSTIGALSCLALGEAITGHLDLWHIHMRGLKQMICTRGSIASLPSMLQMKLRRSDVTGAIDYAASPYLSYNRSKHPPPWSILPPHTLVTNQLTITGLLDSCNTHPSLTTTMVLLTHFSSAIQFARSSPIGSVSIDPTAFAEDMYNLEYELLSFPTMLALECQESDIDRACRLGALLYLKAILEEFPHSSTGSSVLASQLRETLQKITAVRKCSSMLIWLGMVGAVVTKTNKERAWFVAFLAILKDGLGISDGEDAGMEFCRVLGMRKTFGRRVDQILDEVMVTRLSHTCQEDML